MKELIKDLAYDKITLSQGLTRAKLTAFKVGNKPFQDWIKNELEGYNGLDGLPPYRKLICVVKGTLVDGFGREEIVPFSFSGTGKEIEALMNTHDILQSINSLEENYSQLETNTGLIPFTPEQVIILEDALKIRQTYGKRLIKAGKEINKLVLKNIIDQTKQKLIDTLLELEKEFPDFESKFKNNKDNNEKVQNIITNNIYGGNTPLNIAAGNHVVQKDIHNTINALDYTILEKLGVEQEKIVELKKIVETNSDNRDNLRQKAMKWLGSVTASVAGRGLYDNIPAITDFIEKIL